jgi:hypothetical protein
LPNENKALSSNPGTGSKKGKSGEAAQVSINRRINKQNEVDSIIEYHLSLKKETDIFYFMDEI